MYASSCISVVVAFVMSFLLSLSSLVCHHHTVTIPKPQALWRTIVATHRKREAQVRSLCQRAARIRQPCGSFALWRGCVVAIAEEASTRPGITTSRLEAPDRQPGGTLKQPTRHQEQRRAVAAEQPAQSKQPPKRRGGRGRCSHELLPGPNRPASQLKQRKDSDDDRTKRASGR